MRCLPQLFVIALLPLCGFAQSADFANGGFERGEDYWIMPPTASIDSTVAVEGKNSLKITARPGQKGDVVRYVPVIPGRPYTVRGHIRTEGVNEGSASIVVQWAGRGKTWLGTGGRSPRYKGDNDWQQHEILSSLSGVAPAGAEYMIIFLLMRGEGTAWFDGFEVLNDVLHVPDPIAPDDEGELRDNRPTFRWTAPPVNCWYVLQVSQSQVFAPVKTRTFRVPGQEFTPDVPLPQGRLYWRVRLEPSRQYSQPRSFKQLAPTSADTTGPVLTPERQYMPKPQDELVIEASDPSGIDAGSVRAAIDDVDVAAKVDERGIRIRPRESWKRLQWVTVSADDRHGNTTTLRFPVTHCMNVPTRVAFRDDGVVLLNDRPVFPLGVYQVRAEHAMAAAKKVGFDVVHDYKWSKDNDNDAAREYLDQAHRHGLKAWIEFERGTDAGTIGLVQGDIDKVVNRVAALMDHPALFCWYLIDEPEKKRIHPWLMAKYRRLINRLDPFHPVSAVIGMYDTSSFADTMDWHWSESYISTAKVADDFDARGAGLPRTWQAAINRTMGKLKKADGTPNNADDFYRILRPQAYMAIAHGSNALLYWWWSWQVEEMSNPAKQEGMARVLQEIKTLEPVLVAKSPSSCPKADDNGVIHTWMKDNDGYRYIIAVNPTKREVQGKINTGPSAEATVMFEDRTIRAENGAISDTFAPDTARVYRIKLR